MATQRKEDGQEPQALDASTVAALEAGYRNGVDISREEVLDRFAADGYDRAQVANFLGKDAEEANSES